MDENNPEKPQDAACTETNSDNKLSPPSSLPTFQPTKRFWAIISTCAVIGLLSALENTVVTTALPHIVTELTLGENYVWVTNVFFLTGAAVQPLFGQLADIYGRRWVTMVIVAFFTLGSGIAGGAINGAMLIAGRAVQGIGAGGIYIIIDVIVSDLVPLRLRGNYMAVILVVYTIGMALGPWVGGEIVATTTWRWVFYINLPIGGASMIMIFLFLRVQHNRTQTAMQKLRSIDYIGNIILIGSTVAILYALTYGGTKYPWSSAEILSPLIIGLAGLPIFLWYETKATDPVMPPALFHNRTSTTIFIATFLNSALMYWLIFFLPVYFQAVQGASAAQAGVLLLPAILFGIPGGIVAVLLLTRFGRYKPIHLTGFALSILGVGLFNLLDERTTTGQLVAYQLVAAVGSGLVLNTLLPAVQAQVDEHHQAATTAAWSFVRSLGSIWGVAVPAAVFNNRFSTVAARVIVDPDVRGLFGGGNRAYENARADFVASFPSPAREQITRSYMEALRLIWQIAIAFSAANFLVVLFEKEVPLRTELETEFGLEGDGKAPEGLDDGGGKEAEGDSSASGQDAAVKEVSASPHGHASVGEA
ncbi:major facilitator superfamily domain-containing protein [Staphylotrichum tortipilum]|uniref:Major facilitator superfamily domain-containing protein n=1 Tax=Staphylotrichum tortipilum TaxID=2831512 RepID=A0AAN6RU15_9PEZI|nr:major facilitator superfamily domain-containing protein [Staphylotrichum longicolle]